MRQYVVVDTNVLVSGLLTHDPTSPLSVIVDGMLSGRFPLLLSSRLVAEYREVLLRPRSDPPAVAGDANVLAPAVASAPDPAAPDPGDDHLWELLRSVDDAILVTGDRLLVERPPSFSAVMTPRAFVVLLADPAAG